MLRIILCITLYCQVNNIFYYTSVRSIKKKAPSLALLLLHKLYLPFHILLLLNGLLVPVTVKLYRLAHEGRPTLTDPLIIDGETRIMDPVIC